MTRGSNRFPLWLQKLVFLAAALVCLPLSVSWADDGDLSSLEAGILRALGPDQEAALARGVAPEALILENGEDLAHLIQRLEITLDALKEVEKANLAQTTFQGSIIIEDLNDPTKMFFVGDNATYAFLSSWDSAATAFKPMSLNASQVGINTTSPTRTLDVVGDIGALNGFRVTYPTSGVYDDQNSNSPYSRVDADSFHTNGLGVGQIFLEGRALDSNTVIYIGTGVAGGQPAQDVRIGNNNELYVDTSTNRVGVGTTLPDEALEVNGNIKLSGDLVSDGDLCIGSGC